MVDFNGTSVVRVWRILGGPSIGNSRADDGLKVLDFFNLGVDSELLKVPWLSRLDFVWILNSFQFRSFQAQFSSSQLISAHVSSFQFISIHVS